MTKDFRFLMHNDKIAGYILTLFRMGLSAVAA